MQGRNVQKTLDAIMKSLNLSWKMFDRLMIKSSNIV